MLYAGFRFLPEDFQRKGGVDETGLQPLAKTIEDKSSWVLGEKYFDDILATIGDEPGLLFWDISNETGYTDDFDLVRRRPEYLQTLRTRPNMEVPGASGKNLKSSGTSAGMSKQWIPNMTRRREYLHFRAEPANRDLVDVISPRLRHPGRLRKFSTWPRRSGRSTETVARQRNRCLPGHPLRHAIQSKNTESMVSWTMIGNKHGPRARDLYPDGTIRDPSIVRRYSIPPEPGDNYL